ncbi:MAG: hypothetical protein F6K17_02620 [Okeania sp. SIO3C4]|nr:hypothetical protein [Okeania sp. SIO3B3]NER01601.1 hypothetical protein [Okeania sp. SIO3C4]
MTKSSALFKAMLKYNTKLIPKLTRMNVEEALTIVEDVLDDKDRLNDIE